MGDEDELEMIIRRSSVNNISALLHTSQKTSYTNHASAFARSRPISFRHQTDHAASEHKARSTNAVRNKGFSNFKSNKEYLDETWCSRNEQRLNLLTSNEGEEFKFQGKHSPLESQFKSVFNLSKEEQDRQKEEDEKNEDKTEEYSERLASMGLLLPVKKKKVCSYEMSV